MHAVEPREERVGLQLEAEEEAGRLVLHAGDHLQNVVPPEVAAAERLDGPRRAEDLVVHLDDQGQFVHPDHVDDRVRHGSASLVRGSGGSAFGAVQAADDVVP